MKMLLTKKFVFEMAHALDGYDGKCANLHGHSYHLEVTVEGNCASGMVMDFHLLKEIVQRHIIDRHDHALMLRKGSPLAANQGNLIEVDFNPTTENLLLYFASLLEPHLPESTRLHSLRLSETETSTAELVL
jgi:6-pyruvoyltetrahydropterin/6-carboxytetrahydropterin synthase